MKERSQKIKTSSSSPIKPNQGFIDEKIPNFFQGTFMGKQWQISEKQPQKPLENGQKTRDL